MDIMAITAIQQPALSAAEWQEQQLALRSVARVTTLAQAPLSEVLLVPSSVESQEAPTVDGLISTRFSTRLRLRLRH
jgi:hypothetical protein